MLIESVGTCVSDAPHLLRPEVNLGRCRRLRAIRYPNVNATRNIHSVLLNYIILAQQ